MGRALKAGFMAGLGQGVNKAAGDLTDFYWKNRAMQHEEAQAPLKKLLLEAQLKEAESKNKEADLASQIYGRLLKGGDGAEMETPAIDMEAGPTGSFQAAPTPQNRGLSLMDDPQIKGTLEGIQGMSNEVLSLLAQRDPDPSVRRSAGAAFGMRTGALGNIGGMELQGINVRGLQLGRPTFQKGDPTYQGGRRMATAFDPRTGQQFATGEMENDPTKELLAAQELATMEGLPPGSPEFKSRVYDLTFGQMLSPDTREEYLAGASAPTATAPTLAPSGPGASVPGMPAPIGGGGRVGAALDRRDQREVNKAVATRAGTEAVTPLDTATARDVSKINDTIGKIEQIEKYFRPEWVGLGLSQGRPEFQKELQAAIKFANDLNTQVKAGNLSPEEGEQQYAQKFGAFGGKVRAFFGAISPEEAAFRQATLSLMDDMLRLRSGAAINEEEMARITAFAANPYAEPTDFLARLAMVKTDFTRQRDNRLKASVTGKGEYSRGFQNKPSRAPGKINLYERK